MHPLLESKGRILLYLLEWIPIGVFIGFLLARLGGLSWQEATVMMVPLSLFYAFICLSPWYLCRFLPLDTPTVRLGAHLLLAAGICGLLWILFAKLVSLGFSRVFSDLGPRFDRLLPLVFGLGVILYLLAVSFHYVLLSTQASRDFQAREQEARILAREAELKALKAQINPHFLFNSLNSVSALCVMDGARARDMCIRLSDFLRSTLAVGDHALIPLKQELSLAFAYLSVEQIRFGDRLRVAREIVPGCDSLLVPPLLLQPLVENAIKHGVSTLLDGGTLRIEVRVDSNHLRLTVINDFDPDAAPKHGQGIGLANVRRRLEARYGSESRFTAAPKNREFFVEILIPCERAGQSEESL